MQAVKHRSLLRQVFVDRKGRTIDLAQCLVQGNSVLLLVSPSRRQTLLTRLDQYIFFGDKVTPPHSFASCKNENMCSKPSWDTPSLTQ